MPTKFKILRPIVFGLFLLMLLLPLGCERATELRVEGDGIVVVECVLTEDAKQTMRLSLTDQATEADYERLKKADVRVYDETEGVLAGTFTYVKGNAKEGYTMESAFTGLPLHEYRLEIKVEGFGLVTARTIMPAQPVIKWIQEDKTYLNRSTTIEKALPEYETGVRILTSSLPEGPVWILCDEKPALLPPDSGPEEIATNLLNADPFNLTGNIYSDEDSESCAKGERLLYFLTSYYAPGGGVGDIISQDNNKLPLFYPHGRYYYVLGQPAHERYIRIPSVLEGGSRRVEGPEDFFQVSGHYPSFSPYSYPFSSAGAFAEAHYNKAWWLGEYSNLLRSVVFRSLSEEYDLYLKALLVEDKNQEHRNDYASLFDHQNMHSNIENGAGIFGAYTQVRIPLGNDTFFRPQHTRDQGDYPNYIPYPTH